MWTSVVENIGNGCQISQMITEVKEHLSLLTRDIEKGQQKHLPDTACHRLQKVMTPQSLRQTHLKNVRCATFFHLVSTTDGGSTAVICSRSSDVYSAVAFNSRYRVLFALETASAAAEMLQRHPIHPEEQTYYTSGLEGIETCASWWLHSCSLQLSFDR